VAIPLSELCSIRVQCLLAKAEPQTARMRTGGCMLILLRRAKSVEMNSKAKSKDAITFAADLEEQSEK
jgi:hypothetical protein